MATKTTTTDTAATTAATTTPTTDTTKMRYKTKTRMLVGKFWRPAGHRVELTDAEAKKLDGKVKLLGPCTTKKTTAKKTTNTSKE